MTQETTSLIKATPYEELVQKIQEENEIHPDSEGIRTRKHAILLRICSVYSFLRSVLRMVDRPITHEEFSVIEEKMREIAHRESNGFWSSLGFGTGGRWRYYLEYSHFEIVFHYRGSGVISWFMRTAFGNCCGSSKYNFMDPHYLNSNINYVLDNRTYELSCLFPSNTKELLEEMYRKEHPERIGDGNNT